MRCFSWVVSLGSPWKKTKKKKDGFWGVSGLNEEGGVLRKSKELRSEEVSEWVSSLIIHTSS